MLQSKRRNSFILRYLVAYRYFRMKLAPLVFPLMAAVFATFAIIFLVVFTLAAQPANAQAVDNGEFTCSSTAYLSQWPDTTQSGFYSLDMTTRPPVFSAVGTPTTFNYNAIAYNPNDNFIYGVRLHDDRTETNNRVLVRINRHGDVEVVDAEPGVAGTQGVKLLNGNLGLIGGSNGYVSGTFGTDGHYYVMRSIPATAQGVFLSDYKLYKIQWLPNGNIRTEVIAMTFPGSSVRTLDLGWSDGFLYAINNTAPNSNTPNVLFRTNPNTGRTVEIGPLGTTDLNFGAMFGAANGMFALSNTGPNNTGNGRLYQIDLTTGAATLISSAMPFSGSNDGTICPTANIALVTDISVTKTNTPGQNGELDQTNDTYTPGEVRTYTITVSADADLQGARGVLVTDTLPAGVDPSTVTWTCSEAGGGVCPAGSSVAQAGAITNVSVDLEPGEFVTFSQTMTVPTTATQSFLNKVNITVPTGYTDQVPSNDEAVDEDTSRFAPNTAISKALTAESGQVAGVAEAGERLTYTLSLTNSGASTETNYTLSDKFDENVSLVSYDTPGTSTGSVANGVITWTGLQIAVGETVNINVVVEVTQSIPANVTQIANVIYRGTGTPPVCVISSTTCVITPVDNDSETNISILKTAELLQVQRGQAVPYVISVQNNLASAARNMTVVDRIPSGFSYIPGTATVQSVAVEPLVSGRLVSFAAINLAGSQTIEVRLSLRVLSTAEAGAHKNYGYVTDSAGTPITPESEAEVFVPADPIFECAEVIGKVFDDADQDGHQDPYETGLPGVRIVSVNGLLITSDRHGRYSVPCAALPDRRIGSNFLLKIDPQTLPTGYRITTENPRVVRLTSGKMTVLNFGATLGREIRVTMNDDAFVAGTSRLAPRWEATLPNLIELMKDEQTVLLLDYLDTSADPDEASARLKELTETIKAAWGAEGGNYSLDIETRVETVR